jgi:hypothetical protein
MESQSASAAIMCSADDEEDLYSLESMSPGGIIAATEREAVFVWHSFLSLCWFHRLRNVVSSNKGIFLIDD